LYKFILSFLSLTLLLQVKIHKFFIVMKKTFIFFINFLLMCGVYAQTVDCFDKFDTVQIFKYKFKGLGITQCYLQMSYSNYKIFNPKVLEITRDKKIEKIQLVYTKYPSGTNHAYLNKRRLAELQKIAPEYFKNDSIKWELVEQTACTSTDVYNYFHGFVITYGQIEEIRVHIPGGEGLAKIVYGETAPTDSTVLKVFERNLNWDNMLIVSDFTGSMTCYVSQVLLWYHLKIKDDKIKSFVFFNDGDRTPDSEKVIGATGGIYHTDAENIDSVISVAVTTISNGSGGDGPENDIEAILLGLEKYPSTETIILIADNKADMRDTLLISKITKPIKVILCGVEDQINVQYLNLARQSGGSIHTIEEDLTDLVSLNDGEQIKIGDAIYIIEGGRFKFLKKVTNKVYSM